MAKAFFDRLAAALLLALPSSLLLALPSPLLLTHAGGQAIFSLMWATAAVLRGLVTP